MRLFTAISVEGPPLEGLKGFLAFAQGLDLPVKWTPPENLHVTLVFLGDTKEEQLTNLKAALKMAAHDADPFKLEVGGLGAFPKPQKPKTLFMGLLAGRENVESLFQKMTGPLVNAGFKMEDRMFQPHLTLGRLREEPLPPADWERLKKAAPATLGTFSVAQLHLMESRLTPGGSIYKVIESYPLGR